MKKLLILALIGGCASVAFGQNLLTNPGFETGDMTGWTVVNAGGFSGVSNAVGTWPAHSGTWAYHMGATSVATQTDFYQDVATTVGQTYNVSFWAMDKDTAVQTAGMAITFGGAQVGPSRPGSLTYVQFSGDFVATSSTTRLEVTGWESTQYIIVDDFDVHASAVPEPASMAVLGLGALALLRRRRKA